MIPEDKSTISGPNPHNETAPVSKTKQKQHSKELQHLGLELSRLSARTLDQMSLDAKLRQALDDVQKLKPGAAFQRQIKFVGGLLRKTDITPIRNRLDRIKLKSGAAVRDHHRLEKWRDHLIEKGDTAIGELLAIVPAIDRQKIRQLVRAARKQAEQDKTLRANRALYRYLRDCFETSSTDQTMQPMDPAQSTVPASQVKNP